MSRALALWHQLVATDVAAWVQAGTALAGIVASGVAYLIKRAARLERRLDAVENLAGDALAEVATLRDELRDRRGRRWYEAAPTARLDRERWPE